MLFCCTALSAIFSRNFAFVKKICGQRFAESAVFFFVYVSWKLFKVKKKESPREEGCKVEPRSWSEARYPSVDPTTRSTRRQIKSPGLTKGPRNHQKDWRPPGSGPGSQKLCLDLLYKPYRDNRLLKPPVSFELTTSCLLDWRFNRSAIVVLELAALARFLSQCIWAIQLQPKSHLSIYISTYTFVQVIAKMWLRL